MENDGKIRISGKYKGFLNIFDTKRAVKKGNVWVIQAKDPLCNDYFNNGACFANEPCPFSHFARRLATGCRAYISDIKDMWNNQWPVEIESDAISWHESKDPEARAFLKSVVAILEKQILWQ